MASINKQSFWIKNTTSREGQFKMQGEKITTLPPRAVVEKSGNVEWASLECRIILKSSTPAIQAQTAATKKPQKTQEAQ